MGDVIGYGNSREFLTSAILLQDKDDMDYRSLMRAWIALGIPAFAAILILFYLMLSKTGAHSSLFT